MNEQSFGKAWRGNPSPDNGSAEARSERERRDVEPQPGVGGGGRGHGGGGDRRGSPLGYGDQLPSPRSTELVESRGGYLPDAYGVVPGFAGSDSRSDGDLNLRKYVSLLLKHRWMILGSIGVCLVVGLGLTLLTTPIYRASMTMQIDRDVQQVVAGQDLRADDTGAAEFYQTQYELLKSRSLAERVVANLSLQDDSAFVAATSRSVLSRLRSLVFGASAPLDKTSSDAVAARQKQAAGRLVSNVYVEPVRASSIVKVSFDSPNPQVAAKVVNAIADNYIAINLERRYDASTYARTFLEDRLGELKLKLEDSEKQLVAYAQDQNIVDPGTGGGSLAQSNLASANASYNQAVDARVKADLLWQQVQTSPLLPQFLETASITGLRGKKSDLQAQYTDKLRLFKPAYPDMVQLQGQIDQMDKQIASETQVVKDSIKAQYDAAVTTEKTMLDQVNSMETAVNDFRNRNIQYATLQREVDTNQQLYDGLLQRYKEIGVAGGVGVNNVAVVDKAQVPGGPYSPNLTRNLGIALMLGALFGVAGAFAREQFDDSFKSPEEIEESLGLPLLGMVPRADSPEAHAEQLSDPRSALAEAYRSLRTALQFSTTTGVPKTLLVTSSQPGEGKSTTASTLARNFAALGMKVLLIDSDLRKPSLHNLLARDNGIGLANYLTGTTVPPDVFQRTDHGGLTFMASGPLPPNPAELIASAKMLSLLTIAAETYDLVIIDGPPVSGLADAPLLASIADGTLLVIDPAVARRGMVKGAMKRLAFARAQMVGAVVNKIDMRRSAYGYGYGYGAYGGDYYGEAQPKITKPAAPAKGLVARLTRR